MLKFVLYLDIFISINKHIKIFHNLHSNFSITGDARTHCKTKLGEKTNSLLTCNPIKMEMCKWRIYFVLFALRRSDVDLITFQTMDWSVRTSQKLDLGLISTRLKIAFLNFTCPGQRSEIPSQSYHSIQKDCSYNYWSPSSPRNKSHILAFH